MSISVEKIGPWSVSLKRVLFSYPRAITNSYWERLSNHPLGGIIQGLILIALAGVVMGILNSIPIGSITLQIAENQTADLTIIWTIIKVFAPLLMVLSGLRKMGVKL